MSALYAAGWHGRRRRSSPCSCSGPRRRGPPSGSREPATSSAGPWVRHGWRSRRWTARRPRPALRHSTSSCAAPVSRSRSSGATVAPQASARSLRGRRPAPGAARGVGSRRAGARRDPRCRPRPARRPRARRSPPARAGDGQPHRQRAAARGRARRAVRPTRRGCGPDRGQRRGSWPAGGDRALAERREGATRHGHGLAVAAPSRAVTAAGSRRRRPPAVRGSGSSSPPSGSRGDPPSQGDAARRAGAAARRPGGSDVASRESALREGLGPSVGVVVARSGLAAGAHPARVAVRAGGARALRATRRRRRPRGARRDVAVG